MHLSRGELLGVLHKNLLIILCLSLLAFSGRMGVLRAQNYRVEKISVEEGLPYSYITAIHQDRHGFIWLGTPEGLCRFDGYRFNTFRYNPNDSLSLTDNYIYSITEDRHANFWIVTERGIHYFNRIDNTLRRLTLPPEFNDNQIKFSLISFLSPNLTLLSAANTLFVIRPDFSISNGMTFPFKILGIFDDANTNAWLVSQNAIYSLNTEYLNTLNATRSETPSSIQNITEGYHSLVVEKYLLPKRCFPEKMCVDKKRALWFVSENASLLKFIPEVRSFQVIDIQGMPPSEAVNAAIYPVQSLSRFEDDNSPVRLWMTINNGAVELVGNGKVNRAILYSPETMSGISAPMISKIMEDNSGIVWCGIDGYGVEKVDFQTKKFFHWVNPQLSDAKVNGVGIEVPLKSNFIMSLCFDHKGNGWFGSLHDGLTVLSKSNDYKPIEISNKVARDRQKSLRLGAVKHLIAAHANSVWVAFPEKILKMKVEHNTLQILDSINSSSVTNLERDPEDSLSLFFSIEFRGLYHAKWNGSKYRIDTVITASVRTFKLCDDDIWIGTQQGVIVLNRKTRRSNYFAHSHASPESLSDNKVNCIYQDKNGQIWVGTSDGLNHFDKETQTFGRYHVANGLPNNYIYGILEDTRGNLWLSTNNGLSCFNPNRGTFKNYDIRDGLQGGEFNTNSFFKDVNGQLFFGGPNGVTSFYPDSLQDNPSLPNIVFTDFKLFDRSVTLDSTIHLKTHIVLSHEDNVFSMEFAALEYTHSVQNQYSYRMDGVDKEWIYSGKRREVRYTNLSPGNYTFRVRASNNSGLWNMNEKILSITITPPFWKTPLFQFIAIVSATLLTALTLNLLLKRRVRDALAKEQRRRDLESARKRTREKIARDLHDDVASTLGSISLYTETLNSTIAEALKEKEAALQPEGLLPQDHDSKDPISNESLQRLITKIQTLLQEAEFAIEEIVWEISPKNDTLDKTIYRIKRLFTDLCQNQQIHLTFNCDIPNPLIQVSDEIRRNIYLVLKELLTNTLKYAEATQVSVSIKTSTQEIEISYLDNGKGFDPIEAPKGTGNGLSNISARACEINAEITFQSVPGQGMRGRLRVPISNDEYQS